MLICTIGISGKTRTTNFFFNWYQHASDSTQPRQIRSGNPSKGRKEARGGGGRKAFDSKAGVVRKKALAGCLVDCHGIHPVSPAIGGRELGTCLLYKAATVGLGQVTNNGKGKRRQRRRWVPSSAAASVYSIAIAAASSSESLADHPPAGPHFRSLSGSKIFDLI